MNKLLQLFDNYFLKFSVIFTLIFTALYPKLPSVHINHTWVYIRLEDFVIAGVVAIWLVQLIRRKVRLAFPFGTPIAIYWGVGLASLIFSILFIGPHLANFFPKIAALEYFRRIEYMILFFVAFSTIKSIKDARDYIIGLSVALVGVVIYGLGQHFYLTFWQMFPKFFEHNSFCFPSFQTGNEEFAKGIPLCLPENARVTSTFGGHYDLAAYMVMIVPLLFALSLAVKSRLAKIGLAVLSITSLLVLIFTASRVSFLAYLAGIIFTLLFLQRKKLIFPVIAVSILLLLVFSGSTAKRFLDTIRVTSVVTNSQGQVVGVTGNTLPDDLQKKLAKNPVDVNTPYENLPAGSSFITLPQAPVATSVAVVKRTLTPKEIARLKLASGGLELATVSGSFLIQKALVYDISFTTRFQAEWPNAWNAFLRNPPLGSGYSSITLASDNDYVRLFGETGYLGFLSFFLIFIILGIAVKETLPNIKDNFSRAIVLGFAGGVIGLALNAAMIDVFEASKVAEPLWILLGLGVGVVTLHQKNQIPFRRDLWKLLTSPLFVGIYLFVGTLIYYMAYVNTFFVADDFTWLRWAAEATPKDILRYFIDAQGFFYRPIDKSIILGLYTFFSFQPQGYHIFTIFVHFFGGLGVFLLGRQLFKNTFWAGIAAALFLILPVHGEIVFWFSTISVLLATVFMIYGVVSYIKSQSSQRSLIFMGLSILLEILALFSYEMGTIFPLLILLTDVLMNPKKSARERGKTLVPFVVVDLVYLIIRSLVHVAPVGGDYSYNLFHLPQNIIGNLFGYFGLLLTGEWILPWYTLLRQNLKPYALFIGIVALLIAALAIFLLKKYRSLVSNPSIRLISYGIAFAIVALLPFIGFGNISERYAYLASVGFAIAVTALLVILYSILLKNNKKIAYLVCAVILLVVIGWSWVIKTHQIQEWAYAGKITYNSLGYFKVEQGDLPLGSSIYIVNLPIRQANAWIFPVGFGDGLWFVYRDPKQTIHYVSLEEAKRILAQTPKSTAVFLFDKNNQIRQLK